MTDVIEQAQELAKTATSRETFDFAAAVSDRDYPEVNVPIYLDEKKIRHLLDIAKDRDEVLARALLTGKKDETGEKANDLSDKLELLDLEYDELIEELKGQRYVMHLRGISPERTLEIEAEANEAFPKEYDTTTHPITGAPIKTLIEVDDRDILHSALYRQAHIQSVTAPDGAEDSDWADIEKVKGMFLRLPALARQKVDEGIGLATIATDFYLELADEVF